MGFSLALIVVGFLILMDRTGASYGLKEGWPWVVIAFGAGGLLRNIRSIPAWVTTLIGIFLLNMNVGYHPVHVRLPTAIRTYYLPILLICLGLLWLWKRKRD